MAGSALGSSDFVAAQLRREVRSFLEKEFPLERVAELADAGPAAVDPAVWAAIADRGWTSGAVTEDAGGSGLEPAEEAILFEELGASLAPIPFLSQAALAPVLVRDDAQALAALLDGSAVYAVAAGEREFPAAADGAEVACRARRDGEQWRIDGVKQHVPDLAVATVALVTACTDEGDVAVLAVELPCDGARVEAMTSIDPTRALGRLVLDGAPARMLLAPEDAQAALGTMELRRSLALAFDALGVGERVLQMGAEYARTRTQFGKPIGAFQAVALQLVRAYVDLQLARATAAWALRACEVDPDSARLAAAAARAAAADAAVVACENAIQVHGAIGFTWDHPLHRFLRRARTAREQGEPVDAFRERLAERLIALKAPPTVELFDDDEERSFRAGVRSWIAEQLPTPNRGLDLIAAPGCDEVRSAWARRMAQTGHLVAHWPRELGGAGASPVTTAIFREEAVRAHPRVPLGSGGIDLVAPLLIEYGTREQRERWLEAIRTETDVWGQGFSEPDSGSDLASLRMTAVRDGDEWVLTGSKIWTTFGPHATRFIVLARTDPESARHRGITCFGVDADLPGITLTPIRNISGSTEFSQMFFDGVRVPADAVIGEVGEGWNVAVTTLAFERATECAEDVGELEFLFDRLIDAARELTVDGRSLASDPMVRARLASLWCELQAMKVVEWQSLIALKTTNVPPPQSAIIKLAWSEVAQRVARCGMELFGNWSDGSERSARIAAFWQSRYLFSRAFTIYSGTSEILQSIIAEHVLELPRSR